MSALRLFAAFVLVASLSACFDALIWPAPKSGTYVSATGTSYHVSTDKAAALSVSNADTCLMFWRLKDPEIVDGVEELGGEDCSNGSTRGARWTARYDYDAPDKFTLIGPGDARLDIAYQSEARI